ncbi:hypothetical protein G3I59_08135 [Amycolatopsis rubida]|uniref:Uncharacterized protein n=1 Tax=Amycolatopsis rubida TaxID=112413 RepID=A0A1I6B4B1_9PSEU|nr:MULTISPECIES: hypothetical protein [Amycolatopsis]MYW90588.1 hypothetical protein [Amycolatopsis rubida]NEC55569.1 hypothetical protein [Amycolatopsis rubida]OAP29062.1 hypothetical protein A4R44_00856 [Amycolatopsis sp. M39]SFQ75771.1 hypothetical protein SAMN05421854_12337 [Amycolatopsis rubida]
MDPERLDAVARTYTASMTSIRGRRVHRLIMRRLAGYDHVLPAGTAAGAPALLALSADGRAALCHSDGRGPSADLVACGPTPGVTVTSAHDLTKDSLPVLSWTVRHPGLLDVAGPLTIVPGEAEQEEIEAALRLR